MNRIFSAVTVVFLVGVTIFAVRGYGVRWTFGRYAMPRSVLALDRLHYLNGDEIDPVTRAAVSADREEEIMLALVSVVASLLAWLAVELRNVHRTLARDGAMRAELAQHGCLRDPMDWQRRMAEDRRRKWHLW